MHRRAGDDARAARPARPANGCARSRGSSTRRSRIPGTNWRFGLDALFGLVPGLGDIAGGLVAVYALHVARSLRAPAVIQLHMLSNIALDALVGTVPLIGDLFDFVFKAQTRNLALLDAWLATPHQTARRSRRGLSPDPVAIVVVFATLTTSASGCSTSCSLAVSSVRNVCSPVSETTGAQSIASQPMSMPTRAAPSEVQLEAIGSLPALPSVRISTSDSRPSDSGQSRPCSSSCSSRPSGVRKRARPPRSCRSTLSMQLARAPLSFESPRRCRRRTAAPRRDPRAETRRSPRPARRPAASACACDTRTARRR